MQEEVQPTFRGFCSEHGLWDRREVNGARQYTHLELTGEFGGCLNVPDSLQDMIIACYADGLRRKDPFFIVERRTPNFFHFYDIDMKFAKQDRPHWRDFVVIFRELVYDVARFYPDMSDDDKRVTLRCVVASSPDKELPGEKVKVGYHVHFPNLVVDRERALLLHASASSRLSRSTKGKWKSEETFEEALDLCVYEPHGSLRWLGSDKCETCTSCRNNAKYRPTCSACAGKGRIAAGRPYIPMCTLHGDGTPDNAYTDRLYADWAEAVRCTSIRCRAKDVLTPGFKRYESAPSPPHIQTEVTDKTTTTTVCREFPDDREGLKAIKRCKQPIRADDLLDTIETILSTFTAKEHRRTELVSAYYSDTTKREIWVKVEGEGSNYCYKVNRNHNNNRIYFSLTAQGIAQRCWSRKNRCCTKFVGERFPISAQSVQKLFPQPAGRNRSVIEPTNDSTNPEYEEVRVSRLCADLQSLAFRSTDSAADGNPDKKSKCKKRRQVRDKSAPRKRSKKLYPN